MTIFREFTFIDKPTEVEITKSILTTGEELEGAKLQVTDSEGNVVDSWTSEKEPHKITGLVVGKTYQLVETLPADGYVTAETIEFTIADTSEVQPIEMKDDITKLKISKQDIAGNELEGAKLTLSTENGEVIETWTSGKEPHYIEMLPIGKYKLHEEKVVSAKAKYDEALAHVEALKREKELASVNKDIQEKLKSSKRTPEEIMAFLDGE